MNFEKIYESNGYFDGENQYEIGNQFYDKLIVLLHECLEKGCSEPVIKDMIFDATEVVGISLK